MKKRADLNILLVDGDPLFREVLREFIELMDGMAVVGEVRNGREAADAVERLSPNLVLIDAAVPDVGGIRTAIELKGKFPRIGIALLTEYDPKDYSIIAETIGLDGVIQKDSLARVLPRLLKQVNSRATRDKALPRRVGVSRKGVA